MTLLTLSLCTTYSIVSVTSRIRVQFYQPMRYHIVVAYGTPRSQSLPIFLPDTIARVGSGNFSRPHRRHFCPSCPHCRHLLIIPRPPEDDKSAKLADSEPVSLSGDCEDYIRVHREIYSPSSSFWSRRRRFLRSRIFN